jgi:hypothetical protein
MPSGERPTSSVEAQFATLLFAQEESLPFDADPARQRVYRRLVRGSLSGAIRRAMPHARRIAGESVIDAHIARFLAEQPIQTRLVRMIASEFAAFLEQHPADAPRALVELVQWEALEIPVSLAADAAIVPGDPKDDARVEMHPSARLAAYAHPVHLVTRDTGALPSAREQPTILLAWREGERFTWRTLSGGAAKVLVELASDLPIARALDAVDAKSAPDDRLDRALVKSTLVELNRRGAIARFVG